MAADSPWAQVLACLWVEGTTDRPAINLPDTILLGQTTDEAPFTRWIFTTKAGSIAKKLDENLTVGRIRKAFLEGGKSVTVYFNGNRQPEVLGRDAFEEFLTACNNREIGDAFAFQFCPAGLGPTPAVFRVSFTATSAGRPVWRVKRVTDEGSEVPSHASRINAKVQDAAATVVAQIAKFRGAVLAMVADFVVDSSDHAWLTFVEQLDVQPLPVTAASESESKSIGTHWATPTSAGGPDTPTNSRLGGSKSTPVLGAAVPAGAACKGQFCGCSVEHVDTGVFVIKRPPGANTGVSSFHVANKSVLLAKKTAPYLSVVSSWPITRIPPADSEIAARWKAEDSQLQYEMGSRDPNGYYKQVGVCEACYSVYSELDKHRKRGFRVGHDPLQTETSPSNDRRASSLSRSPIDISGGARPSSEQGQPRQSSKRTKRGSAGTSLERQRSAPDQDRSRLRTPLFSDGGTGTPLDLADSPPEGEAFAGDDRDQSPVEEGPLQSGRYPEPMSARSGASSVSDVVGTTGGTHKGSRPNTQSGADFNMDPHAWAKMEAATLKSLQAAAYGAEVVPDEAPQEPIVVAPVDAQVRAMTPTEQAQNFRAHAASGLPVVVSTGKAKPKGAKTTKGAKPTETPTRTAAPAQVRPDAIKLPDMRQAPALPTSVALPARASRSAAGAQSQAKPANAGGLSALKRDANGQLAVPGWDELRAMQEQLGVAAPAPAPAPAGSRQAAVAPAAAVLATESSAALEVEEEAMPAVSARASRKLPRPSGAPEVVEDVAARPRLRMSEPDVIPESVVSSEPSTIGGVDAARWAAAVSRLQEEVTSLQQRLRSSGETNSKLEAQLKDVQRKLEQTQRLSAKALQEKQDTMDRALLEMEQRCNAELAAAMSGHVSADSAAPAKELLNTIESLHRRYDAAERAWSAAKQAAEEDGRRALAEQAHKHSRELAAAKASSTALEDRIASLQSQLAELMRDVSVAQKREQAASNRESALLTEVKQLKLQLANSPSAAAAESAATTSGPSGTSDLVPIATYQALRSTSEGRIRQLTNEVQYLQAQLASELTCKEELGKSLAELTSKFGDAKQTWRSQQAELQASHQQEVEELHVRFARQLDEPRAEIAHLEEKVLRLQSQLKDMIQDATESKRREEVIRRERGTLAEENATLKSKMASVEAQLNDLKSAQADQAEASDMKGAIKAAADAAVRRAQNEATFLRTQLATEIKCKDSLQEAVNSATARLDSIEAQRKKDREEWESATERIRQAHAEQVADLENANIGLEGEVLRLSQTLADNNRSLEIAREQLREAMAALDVRTVSIQRLEEALSAAEKDGLAAKVAAGQAATRHQQSLAAAQAAVQEVTATKDRIIAKLQQDLQSKVSQISDGQLSLLEIRERVSTERVAQIKAAAADKMAVCLQNWQRNRARAALYKWHLKVKLHEERARTTRRMENELLQVKTAMGFEREKAVSMLLTEYRADKKAALDKAKRDAEVRISELAGMAACDRESERLRAAEWVHHAVQMQRARATTELELQKRQADAQLQAALAAAEAEAAATAQAMVDRLSDERRVAIKAWEEQSKKEVKAALAAASKENEAAITSAVAAAKSAAEAQLASKLAAERTAASAGLAEARLQWENHMREVQANHKMQVQAALEEERNKSAAAMAALEQKHRDHTASVMKEALADREATIMKIMEDKSTAVSAVQETLRRELDRQRVEWETKMAEAHAKVSAEAANAVAKAVEDRRSAIAKAQEEGRQTLALKVAELNQTWAAKLEQAVADAKEKVTAQMQEQMSARLQAVEAGHSAQIAHLQERAMANLAEAQALMEERATQLRAEAAAAQTALAKHAEEQTAEQLSLLANQLRNHHDQEMAALRAAHAAELKTKLEEAERSRQAAVEAFIQESDAQAARVKADMEAKIRSAVAAAHATGASEIQEALNYAEQQHEQDMQRLREALDQQHRQELEAVQEQAQREQEEAVEELRQESEKLLGSIENAMTSLMSEKKKLEEQLANTKADMVDMEDSNFDLQQQISKLRNAGALHRLQYVMQGLKYANLYRKARIQWEQDANNSVSKAEAVARRDVALLKRQIALQKDQINALESMRATMQETLMNHKRELLMEHKVQSTNLSADLARLEEEKQEAEGLQGRLLQEVGELEGGVRALERELREHSKASAIDEDGKVNVQYRRKKKRLDEELEKAVDRVAGKREQLHNIQARVQSLEQDRQEKEEQMREIESTLVSVLIEQQKQLLQVLNSVEAPSATQSPAQAGNTSRAGKAVRFEEHP